MSYTDQEMRNFTQIAYADFGRAFDILCAKYPDRTSFSISELEAVARRDNSGIDLSCLKCLTASQKNNWKLSAVMDTNSENGFYACVIETAPGQAAVAFRGSEDFKDPSNLQNDWINADIGLLNSTETNQHQQVRRMWEKYNDLLNSYDSLTLTGHSLGGNLAEYGAVVSHEYGLDDNISRCVSFDGPGFSNEFIARYASDISRMKDKMTHYRWSLVGGMLFDLPGAHYITCQVSDEANTKDDDRLNFLTRHDTKYLSFDENGNIIRGHRDAASWIMYDFSKYLDSLYSGNGFGILIMPYLLVRYQLTNIEEIFQTAWDGMKTVYKNISDAIHRYLNRNNVYFKVNTTKLLSDADKISASLNRVRAYTEEMFKSVQMLNGMWKGPANSAFSAKFAKEKEAIDRYLDRILSYVNSIEKDAEDYDSCENRVLSIVSSLRF